MSDFTAYQCQITSVVEKCIELASDYFNQSLVMPDVRFDLRGKSAGQARFEVERAFDLVARNKSSIRFNRLLMEENFQAFIDDVAPHETAHVIARQVYGGKIKPHGQEWRMIMRDVLNKSPSVTHQFDVTRASPKPFIYQCECTDVQHALSAIRHNRIQRKQSTYLCRQCNSSLSLV
jgi:SprT protein